MYIYECLEFLKETDLECLIRKRLPESVKEKIYIVSARIDNSSYADVAFHFEQDGILPEVFYTHIYVTEMNQYLTDRNGE